MNLYYQINRVLRKSNFFYKAKRYSTIKILKDVDIEKIRNMGILAHIDAGIVYVVKV